MRPITKHRYYLVVVLTIAFILGVWGPAWAAGPESQLAQTGGRQVGLVSTTAACVTIAAGTPQNVSTSVRLAWTGQIEKAYLVLAANGSSGAHSLYVNGRRVGSAPLRPGGAACQPYFPEEIPIPPEILVQGENEIVLTNDADGHDSWTAAEVHLEIHGVLSGPPVSVLEEPALAAPPALSGGSIEAASVSGSVLLPSSYEAAQGATISQTVYFYIPTAPLTPAPLLIALHGKGGGGNGTRNLFISEAEARGWLVAAPDMHGKYNTNSGRDALAWVGAQHDVIDTIEWMIAQGPVRGYTVDKSRIYVTGGSMGGQTTAMMVAKYPDLFASAVPWKTLTNLTDWYSELGGGGPAPVLNPPDPYNDQKDLRRETAGSDPGTTPAQNPFEYQRRSPVEFPQNSRLLPIKIWHDLDDIFVKIHHSRNLRNAINSWSPPAPVQLVEVPSAALDCPTDNASNGTYELEHCLDPNLPGVFDLDLLFDFLQASTRNPNPPPSLNIRTDESKSYYWLKISQSGGDHWTQIQASYNLATRQLTAVITDTQAVTVAFNLGSNPLVGPGGISQAGIGFSAGNYLVDISGANTAHYGQTYSSGYFNVILPNSGQSNLTISLNSSNPLSNFIYLPVMLRSN